MANKNARILWAVMTRQAAYDPRHVSVKPQCKVPLHQRPAAAPPAMARHARPDGNAQPTNRQPIQDAPSTIDVLSKMH